MLGIRSSDGYDKDRSELNWKHVLIAALICVLAFILSLFFLVRFLTAK